MPINYDNKTGEFILTLNDFSGGLNSRDIDSKIRDNELSAIRDFVLDKRGALTIRPGFDNLLSTEWIASTGIMSEVGYYKIGATPKHIITSGTKIGSREFGSPNITDIKTGLTAGLHFDMHQFQDKLFMCNGTDNIQVYNGSTVWDIGYPIPSSGVTATEGTTGVLENKVYQYKVSFYYDDGESNANATATSITPSASKKVELTNIPTGTAGRVTQRVIYRTEGNGSTFKLLTTITDNTTTTFSDNTPDAGLGADLDTDNTYTYMQKCKYCVSHKGRMWFAGDSTTPSRVFYSKALSSEANPSLYYWDIGSNDGDVITGLMVNLGALVIFKKYSTWVLTGSTPTGTDADMVLEKVNPSIGTISIATAKHTGNDIMFLTPSQGVHRLHRIILAETESMDVQAISSKVDPTVNEMNSSYFSIAHAQVFDHKYMLFLPFSEDTTPSRALVLELANMNPAVERTVAWTVFYNMNFSSSCLFTGTDGEHLYLGANALGYVYEYGQDYTSDDGTQITPYAVTKYFDMGSFASYKIGRDLFIHGRASEDYEFSIRLFINTVDAGVSTEDQIVEAFSGGGAVSGTGVMYDDVLYDDVLYDSDGDYTNNVVDIMRSMYVDYDYNKIKLKIESISANREFAFYGFELKGFMGGLRQQG